jgi:conjugal transfer/entry exclusion protein
MDGYLLQKISHIRQTCHAIEVLLEADQTHFSNNKMDALGESNQEKTRLLDTLSHTVGELKSHLQTQYPGKTLDTIDASPAFQEMITSLKQELQDCYQALAVNNHIVYANLQHLKAIWDKILASQKSTDCIYDQAGILSK